MITKKLTVLNSSGFHVRSASAVCKLAMGSSSKVTLSKGSAKADCKSCLELLSLMAPQGTELELVVQGDDENYVASSIEELFKNKFNENEPACNVALDAVN